MKGLKVFLLFFSYFLLIGACRQNKRAPIALVNLSIEEAVDRLLNSPEGTLTVIDVRTPEELVSGKVEGALNLDLYSADFEERVKALDRSQRYFLYCRSGARARKAANLFRSLNFKKIYLLRSGGYAQLRAGGAPTTQ